MTKQMYSLFLLLSFTFFLETNSRTLHGIKLKRDTTEDLEELEVPEWEAFESELQKDASADAPEKLTLSVTNRTSQKSGAQREVEPFRLYADSLNTFSLRVYIKADTPDKETIRAEMLYIGENSAGEEQSLSETLIDIGVSCEEWTPLSSSFQIPELSDDIDWLNIKLRISGPSEGVDFKFRDVIFNTKYIDPGITNFTTENIIRWGIPLGALALVIFVIFYSSLKEFFTRRGKGETKKDISSTDVEKIPPMKKDEPLVPHTTPQKRLHPGYHENHHDLRQPVEFHQNQALVS